MYLTSVEIENTGPIEYLKHAFSFGADGKPKPTVLVGSNGSGKSLVLSYILGALFSAKSRVYEQSEVEAGKVYKLRSGAYISHSKNYLRGKVVFGGDFFETEIHCNILKERFEQDLMFTPMDKNWNLIKPDEHTTLQNNFQLRKKELLELFEQSVFLYFPPNRFEDPAWLNASNLNSTAEYLDSKRITGISNRNAIQYSPMQANQSWLLDLAYDSFAIDPRATIIKQTDGQETATLPELRPATAMRIAIETFLRSLLKERLIKRFGCADLAA